MNVLNRRIITHNVRKGPDKHKGILMSINNHGTAQTLNIYIPKEICVQFIRDNQVKFHVAESLDEPCLYLIPDPNGLTANKTSVGKQIIHLNLGYLEAYKVVWPEVDINSIRATQVNHEIVAGEIKIYCPSWLKKVGN